ncbi:hypothetical protein AB1Y20_000681 [Prymnesium parvum]|uniref:Histone acetyltransferase n=1 Tax=Prymnesium parvum TaxID=97485 RepID=A0AB34K6J2_PRYPA
MRADDMQLRRRKRSPHGEADDQPVRPRREVKNKPIYKQIDFPVFRRLSAPVKKNVPKRRAGSPAKPGGARSPKSGARRGGVHEKVKLSADPLLRASQVAAEWGWKMRLEAGAEPCLLYYGCPSKAEYFCCERHRVLWCNGEINLALMPESWKTDVAPDPEGIDEKALDEADREALAKRAEHGQTGGKSLMQQQVRGLASWMREGQGEEEQGEEEEEQGEEEQGEEEQGEDHVEDEGDGEGEEEADGEEGDGEGEEEADGEEGDGEGEEEVDGEEGDGEGEEEADGEEEEDVEDEGDVRGEEGEAEVRKVSVEAAIEEDDGCEPDGEDDLAWDYQQLESAKRQRVDEGGTPAPAVGVNGVKAATGSSADAAPSTHRKNEGAAGAVARRSPARSEDTAPPVAPPAASAACGGDASHPAGGPSTAPVAIDLDAEEEEERGARREAAQGGAEHTRAARADVRAPAPREAALGGVAARVATQQLLARRDDCLLCRAAAALARLGAHPHAPPFSAPVDRQLFADYAARVGEPIDLRTICEKLCRGLYGFGASGDESEGAARLHADVRRVWSNCRAYNPPRATVVRMLPALEAAFDAAWDEWVVRRRGGWEPWLCHSAAALVPVARGGRLPSLAAARPHRAPPRPKAAPPAPPPPSVPPEAVAALPLAERRRLLEKALPNRAPPPPGWEARDVGGCPWHTRDEFLGGEARRARAAAEEAMKKVVVEAAAGGGGRGEAHAEAARGARKVASAAIGKRVLCVGNSSRSHMELRGVYQANGTVVADDTKEELSIYTFCERAGNRIKRPLATIRLEDEEVTLQELIDRHGAVPPPPPDGQHDPHCKTCGGGDSSAGNEILLCDGLRCVNNFHQQCMEPPVLEVPEGAWLCPACVADGNIVDPEVLEDERRAAEARGGVEELVVLSNDGMGLQDIELLLEVLDVIDSSLPLIGRVNAAKLIFAPDHQALVLTRTTEHARRVLGAIVIKPHRARGFLEIAFCVVRKEEQRSGVGSRIIRRLKEHAVENLHILHLLTYADDSAITFFEKLGFDDPMREEDPQNGMPINRFHWGISHYIGSQLRQCVLDPDGYTLYSNKCRRKVPPLGRRLPEAAPSLPLGGS